MSKFCLCITKQEDDIKVLNFSHCSLKDVPSDVFNTERTLEELYLDANQIRDLPRELFYCHGINKLNISDNEITCLPPAIASLINLEELDISKNGILDLPENIKGCKVLSVIEASVNPLGKLPDGFTQLFNLTQLYLNDCFLDFLPASFGRLSKLKILELRENHLKTLPKSMSRLTDLQRLDIGNNDFTSMPEVIGGLVRIQELWCDVNAINRIPQEFGNLKELIYLDATKNRIETVPEEIEGCCSLSDLHLSTNMLNQLPNSIGRLSKLMTLKVDDNQLTSLPFSIGGLVSLRELDVSANDLLELPPSIGLLRQLHTLLADENFLYELPPELGSCSGITILSVRSNKLNYVPEEIGRIPRLRVLNLADNEIRAIPYSFTKLKQLQAMWLAENQAKPLIRLQKDIDVDTGKRMLTCYLLPQQPSHPEDNYSEHDSFHVSTWDQERAKKSRIKFDFGDQEDPELKYKGKKKNKLNRTPTPFPKEMKERARHHRNMLLRKGSITNGDMNGDVPGMQAGETGTSDHVDGHYVREKSKSPIMMERHYLYQREKEKLQKDKARMQQHRERTPERIEDEEPILNNQRHQPGHERPKDHDRKVSPDRKKKDDAKKGKEKPNKKSRIKSEDDDGGFLMPSGVQVAPPLTSILESPPGIDRIHPESDRQMSQSQSDIGGQPYESNGPSQPLHGVPLSQAQIQKYKEQAKRVLINRLEVNSDTGYQFQKRGHGHRGVRRPQHRAIRECESDIGHQSDTDFYRKYNNVMPSFRDGYTSDWGAIRNMKNVKPTNREEGYATDTASRMRLDPTPFPLYPAKSLPEHLFNQSGSNVNLHSGERNYQQSNMAPKSHDLTLSNPKLPTGHLHQNNLTKDDWRNELLSVLQQKRKSPKRNVLQENETGYSPATTMSDEVFTPGLHGHKTSVLGQKMDPNNRDHTRPQYRPPPPYRKPPGTVEAANITHLGEPPSEQSNMGPNPRSMIHPAFRDHFNNEWQPSPNMSIDRKGQDTHNGQPEPYNNGQGSMIDHIGQGHQFYQHQLSPQNSPYAGNRQQLASGNHPPNGDHHVNNGNHNGGPQHQQVTSNSQRKIHPGERYLENNFVDHHRNIPPSNNSGPNKQWQEQRNSAMHHTEYSGDFNHFNNSGPNTRQHHVNPTSFNFTVNQNTPIEMKGGPTDQEYKGERSFLHISKTAVSEAFVPDNFDKSNANTHRGHINGSRSLVNGSCHQEGEGRTSKDNFNSYGSAAEFPQTANGINPPPPEKPHEIKSYEDVERFKPQLDPSSQVSSSTDSGYGHAGSHIYEKLEFNSRFPGYALPNGLAPPNRQPPGPPQYMNQGPGVGSRESTPVQARDSGHGSFDQQDGHMFIEGPKTNIMSLTVHKNPGLGFSIAGGIGSRGNPFKPNDQGIFVTKVQTDGPAFTKLRPGDRIIEVNGLDFSHIEHTQAVTQLKTSKPAVSMTLIREEPLESFM